MSLADIIARSDVNFDVDMVKARLKDHKNSPQCTEIADVAAALERARGLWDAKAFAFAGDTEFEVRRAAHSFPGKCFADLARNAILKTVELFREFTCIAEHEKHYKDRVHACAKCEDHFRGYDVEIDHVEVQFHQILVAFLDSHVPNWCILPDANTVTKKPNYGYRSRIQQSHRVDDKTETVSAYWQRVRGVSARRWSSEGLAAKFVAFHNSAAKLQALCVTCHAKKTHSTGAYVPVATPVHIEALGKSKKRQRNDELVEQIVQEEAVLLDRERITGLITDLRAAIVSMQRAQIMDALDNIPTMLHDVLPMVNTARQLLNDIAQYDAGEVHVRLNSLPTEPHEVRKAMISWQVDTIGN